MTSGSNYSLGLFYSIYLGPEIIEDSPYYGREDFVGGIQVILIIKTSFPESFFPAASSVWELEQ